MSALRRLVVAASARLANAGVESASHDAHALARAVLARTDGGRYELVDDVSDAFRTEFDAAVARREAREPLQLITGEAHFHGLTLATRPGVFIPRPETELLVADALDALREMDAPARRPLTVVDLCTGTGAIAIAIAHAVPEARVWAVEIDPAAASLARENARTLDVRVTVVEGDAADALPELDGTVDVVLSNPPYIPAEAVPRDAEVRDWDPHGALFGGGEDGLDTPRVVVASAARLLRDGGLFLMEHADVQGEAVRDLVSRSRAFTMSETRRDLTGRDRYVAAVRERS